MNGSDTSSASYSSTSQQSFFFWEPILKEGGIIIASPYTAKYHGGVSPRDALAMANVLALFSPWHSRIPIRAEIRGSLTPEMEQENIILIGSGSANLVVPDIISDLEKAGTPLSFSLGSGYWQDYACLQGKPSNIIPRYVTGSPQYALDLGAQFCLQDFGLIARAPNPHKTGKVVTFIAGIHGYGTLAASYAFCASQHQNEIEQRLRSESIAYSFHSEINRRDAVVEILLRASVGDYGHDRDNPVRRLDSIDIEFVRVGSTIDRQSPSEPSDAIYTYSLPAPRRVPNLQKIALFCDYPEKGDRAFVELRGVQSKSQFCSLQFSESDCRNYDNRISNALRRHEGWGEAVRRIGQELEEKLNPLFLLAPREIPSLSPHELIYRFSGPHHHLRIPFEATRAQNDQFYLSLIHPVVRSISGALCNKKPLASDLTENLRLRGKKLRVLLIGSNPLGDVPGAEAEVARVEEILAKFSTLVSVTRFTGRHATSEAFQAAVRSDEYHIIHYAGHTHWDHRDPRLSHFLLRNAHGQPDPIYLRQIENWLRGDSKLSFFYLSSCNGAKAGTNEHDLAYDFSGIADSLVRAGVPAVLGFRESIEDRAGKVIAEYFYQSLFQLRVLSLPHALLLTRQRAESDHLDTPNWLMPVLVMQQ